MASFSPIGIGWCTLAVWGVCFFLRGLPLVQFLDDLPPIPFTPGALVIWFKILGILGIVQICFLISHFFLE